MPKLPLPRKLLCHWLPADSEEENVPLHHHLLFSSRHVCHRFLDQVKYCSWKVDLILSSFLLDPWGEKGFQQSWLIPFSSFLLFSKKKVNQILSHFPCFFQKSWSNSFPVSLCHRRAFPAGWQFLSQSFLFWLISSTASPVISQRSVVVELVVCQNFQPKHFRQTVSLQLKCSWLSTLSLSSVHS